ncbi:hypothetical protein S96127_3776 [Yersinia pestis]|nr:hypothetical protein S96127_3776 [Yersinia pestis]
MLLILKYYRYRNIVDDEGLLMMKGGWR